MALLKDKASHLLRQPLYPNLEEVRIRLDLLSDLTIAHLVHVPVGEDEASVQESGLVGGGPDGKMASKVC